VTIGDESQPDVTDCHGRGRPSLAGISGAEPLAG
jgi:hypothetical protein